MDISDGAISSAHALSEKTGLPASFERAVLYDWTKDAARTGWRFDAAFSSYGAVCRHSDLEAWAGGVAAVLAPGGRFVLVDFHPAAEMFEAQWNLSEDYPSDGVPWLVEEGVGDYVAEAGAA